LIILLLPDSESSPTTNGSVTVNSSTTSNTTSSSNAVSQAESRLACESKATVCTEESGKLFSPLLDGHVTAPTTTHVSVNCCIANISQ